MRHTDSEGGATLSKPAKRGGVTQQEKGGHQESAGTNHHRAEGEGEGARTEDPTKQPTETRRENAGQNRDVSETPQPFSNTPTF